MILLNRSSENPVLLPSKKNTWEAEAAFNGSVVKDGKDIHMVYRAISSPQFIGGTQMEVSTIGYAVSHDGVHFGEHKQLIKPEYEWERYGCEDPRVTKIGDTFYIFYTALSTYPFTADGIKIAVAITKNFKKIIAKHPVTHFNSKAMALFPEKVNGKYAAILTAHTDMPPSKIALALFDKIEDIWSKDYWDSWYENLDDHKISLARSLNDQVEIGAPPILTKQGWLIFYSHIQNYYAEHSRIFGIEAAFLDLKNPQKIAARTFAPLLVPEEEYEIYGRVPKIAFPSGATVKGGKVLLYYGAVDTTCCLATVSLKDLEDEIFLPQSSVRKFARYEGNPIIEPSPSHEWEKKATFNPAAIFLDGKVHILYRAMSGDDTSSFGYASSRDFFHISERSDEPVYVPRKDFETKRSPGNSGCEDPRLTQVGDTIYMCYTAFNGDPPRVALTSISLADFLEKKWKWTDPVLISPPGVDDKDACVLPEKIDGRFGVIHRIGDNMWLDYVDDLNELGNGKWIKGKVIMKPRANTWDSKKIGLASTPIKTSRGWVMLYHGVSETSNKYRLGAALFDINDPTKLKARTTYPLLEPEMRYEKEGIVPNVVFPCGSVMAGNDLVIYYGGGDRVTGVASISFKTLFESLIPKKIKK